MLSLQDKKRTLVGLLEIEKAGDGWTAYLEGGPTTVESDGDNVVIIADSRDIRGFVFDRKMSGKIDGDTMSGTYVQVGASASKEGLPQILDGPDACRRRMARVVPSLL
jgi:hypothetical protein